MVTSEQLLRMAKEVSASDVHLTAGLPPKVRVGGKLKKLDYPKLTAQDIDKIASNIMNDRQMQIFQNKGEVDFSFSIKNIGRFRANIFRQRGITSCVMRIVANQIPSTNELGISDDIVNMCIKKKGLVIITGYAGCGKSTTIASLINRINENTNAHIITLEDPIEYIYEHKQSMINQREIGIDTASYSAGISSALRQDPDVIYVGELQDLDTIATTITAAETGCLVFATLNTIGTVNAIDRIVSVFPEYKQQQIRVQLSIVLNAVVSQQLLPIIHSNDRTVVFEALKINPEIRELIRTNNLTEINELMKSSQSQDMITMDNAIIQQVKQDIISDETALEYAMDAEYVNSQLTQLSKIKE